MVTVSIFYFLLLQTEISQISSLHIISDQPQGTEERHQKLLLSQDHTSPTPFTHHSCWTDAVTVLADPRSMTFLWLLSYIHNDFFHPTIFSKISSNLSDFPDNLLLWVAKEVEVVVLLKGVHLLSYNNYFHVPSVPSTWLWDSSEQKYYLIFQSWNYKISWLWRISKLNHRLRTRKTRVTVPDLILTQWLHFFGPAKWGWAPSHFRSQHSMTPW